MESVEEDDRVNKRRSSRIKKLLNVNVNDNDVLA